MASGTIVILAGAPGVGKSMLSYRLGIAVAGGLPFLNFKASDPSRVLLIDEENSGQDARAYIRRNWIGLGRPNIDTLGENLRIEHFSMPARRDDIYPELLMMASGHRPSLIIIDTGNSVTRVTDENDNAEASATIKAFRNVRQAATPDTVLMVLKHARTVSEGGKHRVRGASTWIAETDACLIFRPLHPGRPRLDGLRQTVLEADKVRAFGLADPILITPSWSDSNRTGLILKAGKLSENP